MIEREKLDLIKEFPTEVYLNIDEATAFYDLPKEFIRHIIHKAVAHHWFEQRNFSFRRVVDEETIDSQFKERSVPAVSFKPPVQPAPAYNPLSKGSRCPFCIMLKVPGANACYEHAYR